MAFTFEHNLVCELMLSMTIQDGVVVAPRVAPEKLWKFFHELITDAHLPVVKPCAVALTNRVSDTAAPSVSERMSECAENIIEISARLKDMIFIQADKQELTGTFVNTQNVTTELTLPEAEFRSSMLAPAVPYLYTEKHVARFLNTNRKIKGAVFLGDSVGHGVSVYLVESTGYREMKLNTAPAMKEEYYFPFNTYHSLLSYVRILPYNGATRIRFYNGMTQEIFLSLMQRYYVICADQSKLGRGEQKWLSNYQL